MRLLLDTHILLWALSEPERLPDDLVDALTAPNCEVYVSAASIWEIAIKQALRRDDFTANPAEVSAALPIAGFRELPVRARHAAEVSALPPLHRDPFDRLLVAQARTEPLVLDTRDRRVVDYPVQTWRVP